MAIELNAVDLAAVAKIQELKITTIEEAKTIYCKAVARLANPDIENRAETVLANVERTHARKAEEGTKPKLTKKERFDATNERKAAKLAAKKAAKPAKSKKAKAPKDSTPATPLAALEREVELTEVGEDAPHVYTANVFGKKHAVVWGERNRGVGAAARFETVNMSEKRIETAQAYGKAQDMPIAVAVTVRVIGKLDQGYIVPFETFKQFKQGDKNGFSLSNAARAAYAQDGWAGVKFSAKQNGKQEKAA
jgi:hypothetical protein